MSFKASGNRPLKDYNKILEKFRSLMNIKFDSEPAYVDNDKYIKKIKLIWRQNKYKISRQKKPEKKVHHAI